MGHISVLLQESIEGLEIHKGDTFFDGTLGSGGHSAYVCRKFGKDVRLIGVDQDEDAIRRAKERVSKEGCMLTAVNSNFRSIDEVLDQQGIETVDRILLDIGLSSNQFEESGRGFSFQKDEPLQMTFRKDAGSSFTARTIVNEWNAEQIATILSGYGEERHARNITQMIVSEREKAPIETTFQLVEIIKQATPSRYHHGRIHPATRTFQALRIAVNDEIEALREGLEKGFERLSNGGRMAVISFHSIEDRIVKRFYLDKKNQGMGEIITKKPITPTDQEIADNPRSRSAKLRIIKKI